MSMRVKGLLVALVVAVGALLGWVGGRPMATFTGGAGAGQEMESPLRAGLADALRAAGDVATHAQAADRAATSAAYREFQAALEKVLAPVSQADPDAARQMAEASREIREELAKGQVFHGGTVVKQAQRASAGIRTAADKLGMPLTARASAELQAATGARAETGVGPGGGAGVDTGAPGAVGTAAKPRVIQVTARNYGFMPNIIDVKRGETVEIQFTNAGTEKHEFEIEIQDREIGPIKPGTSGSMTFRFDQMGTVEFICDVDGHEQKGMRGIINVKN